MGRPPLTHPRQYFTSILTAWYIAPSNQGQSQEQTTQSPMVLPEDSPVEFLGGGFGQL